MKKIFITAITMVSILSMNSISASAAELDEVVINNDSVVNEYVEAEDNVQGEIIDSISVGEYDLVMGTLNHIFSDNAWQNDSYTYSTNIYYGSTNIGTLYCYYQDNIGTDKVQGSYNSTYFHYCNTESGGISSGLSATEEPNVRVYNSMIDYAPGNTATVKGFAYI